jgi:capsular polysaccharide biosynthesis protein
MGGMIVDPDTDTAEEIIQKTYCAKLIIGVEGSHMANAMLTMAKTGCMLIIQPSNRFNNPFKDLCDATGRRYAFTVADNASGRNYQNIKDLMLMIDRCNVL